MSNITINCVKVFGNLKYLLMDLGVSCASCVLFSSSKLIFGRAEAHLALFRIVIIAVIITGIIAKVPVHKLALTMFHPIPVDLIRLLLLEYFVSQFGD